MAAWVASAPVQEGRWRLLEIRASGEGLPPTALWVNEDGTQRGRTVCLWEDDAPNGHRANTVPT